MELKRYWQILLRRRNTLFKIVLIIVGTVILGTFIISPVYSFKSKIWVKNIDPKATLTGVPTDLVNLGSVSSDLVMYTQLALIKNFSMIQDIIAKMNLEKSKRTPFPASDFLEPSAIDLLLYKKGVRVDQVASSQIIEVAGFSNSPEEAKEIANQVADAFVEFYNKNAQAEGKQSLKSIQDRLTKVSPELQKAENELAEYKVANHLNNVTYLRERLITNLVTLQSTIDDNKTEIVNLQKNIAAIQKKLKKVPKFSRTTLEYRSNNTLEYIRGKIMDAEGNMASSGIRAKPEYYTQKQYQATINNLKDQYRNQAAKVFFSETTGQDTLHTSLVKSLVDDDISLTARTARLRVLDQIFLNRQNELDDLTIKEITLGSLQRKVTALQTSQSNLLTQEQTAILAIDVALSNASVVERPAGPAYATLKNFRWFPKRKLLLALSFLFGLIVGLATILFQEHLDNTLPDPVETEGYLHFPVVANLPEVPPEVAADLAKLAAYGPWNQAIWGLPDMVKLVGEESLARVWAVSSSVEGEGKSIVTASLGRILALRGLKVLLIDLNCSHPSLASLWHLPPADGVSELLKGAASMSDSVRKVGPEELYLLPYGKADDVVWQLAPKILADWLATLKNGFDVLLLDLPAVGYGEGASLAALADQTLMVVAADHTPREQVARALEQIQRCGAKIAGIVLNRYRKLELWPLISPTISAMANWPPVSRLGTSLKNRGKFKSS